MKFILFLSGVSEINMKTLSGCANFLCGREVLPRSGNNKDTECHYQNFFVT